MSPFSSTLLSADCLATLVPAPGNPLGLLSDAAVCVEGDRIAWVGPLSHAPAADVRHHAPLITPGLIDSHTHTIFAGDRSDELGLRLSGLTYPEIAARGGGIRKTVQATRQASEETLYTLTRERLLAMQALGVTTVEVKTGYGLDADTEQRCLRVLARLKQDLAPMRLVITYMGAHDWPPGANPDAYVDWLCTDGVPQAAPWVDCVDVFCEVGYFSVEQSRRILRVAQDHGLLLKVHADEFNAIGATELAAEMGAVSADHLLHITPSGIEALKASGTVATLLPGTAFYLGLKQYAPAAELLAAGVPVALATDFNPGSCPIINLQWVMQLACLQMNMTPETVFPAVTTHAARALGLPPATLAPGQRADLALWDLPHPAALLYYVGQNRLQQSWAGGQRLYPA
jgi:imidazolonepropionase